MVKVQSGRRGNSHKTSQSYGFLVTRSSEGRDCLMWYSKESPLM